MSADPKITFDSPHGSYRCESCRIPSKAGEASHSRLELSYRLLDLARRRYTCLAISRAIVSDPHEGRTDFKPRLRGDSDSPVDRHVGQHMVPSRLLRVLVFAVAALQQTEASAEAPSVSPLVRFVLDTDEFPDSHGYIRDVYDGTLIFNERFRNPTVPQSTPIKCDTRAIGLTYGFTRPKGTQRRSISIAVRWQHSAITLRGKAVSHRAFVDFVPGEQSVLMHTSIRLTDARKHNGVYSVALSSKGRLLFETSFSMTGCPDAA